MDEIAYVLFGWHLTKFDMEKLHQNKDERKINTTPLY